MMSITPGSGSMGPTPIPGGSDRSGPGGEGTEGFAALLAGVMVPPPPQPVAQAAGVRGGNAPAVDGETVAGDGVGTSTGGTRGGASGAGDAGEEGAPVDPRALLLRAGIRTGEPPRAPRGPAFGPSSVTGEAGATVAAATPASVSPQGAAAAEPATADGTAGPEGPDVMGATRGGHPDPGKVAPLQARGPDGPTLRSGEGPETAVATPDPGKASGTPAATGTPRPLPPHAHLALPALDVPMVDMPGVDMPRMDRSLLDIQGVERPGMAPTASGTSGLAMTAHRTLGTEMGRPVDSTVARALAAAGLDPADVPALQGEALPAALSEADSAGPALPVTAADRSMTRLDPDFRVRLERVVERLQTEHGIEARFLEGFRPQLRQEHLYAQGRTAPGPVVTWTLNSMHTQGRAADLKLEGGAESYRIMHQVAAEEGLRTLGMKDPGHLELPRTDGAAGRGASATTPAQGPGTGSAVLPVGVTTGPQGVARVARVAQVAAPARPGMSAPLGSRMNPVAEGARSITRAAGKGEGTTEATAAHGGEGTEVRGDIRTAIPLPEAGLATLRAPVAPGAGVASMDRVAELEQLRESAPLGPMRRIDLRDADGQGTRVRIEMKGDVVQTEIRTPDGDLARRLEPASRELEGALERHGLELGRLKVGRSAEVIAPRDFIPPPVAEPNRGQSGGEDPARQGQQRTPRDGEGAHDQPRHRPRPDHPDREYQP